MNLMREEATVYLKLRKSALPPLNDVEPNQNHYQQAVRNQNIEQRSVLDCFANTVVENCDQLLCCMIVL